MPMCATFWLNILPYTMGSKAVAVETGAKGSNAVFTIGPCTLLPTSQQLVNSKGYKFRLSERRPQSCASSIAPGNARCRELSCCMGFGATILSSAHIPSRGTFPEYDRKSKRTSQPSVLVTAGGGYKLIA